MQEMDHQLFHLLVPGKPIEGDWCNFPIPLNITVGENTMIDSSFTFKNFCSELPVGLKIGSHVTLRTTRLSVEPKGYLEIGDYCFISSASIACYQEIIIGNYVFIAGGVNIVDTDFHPIAPADRLRDTVALSTVGNKQMRPVFSSAPVIIEDDVWIGYNATILKGVRIGRGAIIQPGTVVLKDVKPGTVVSGNPARVVDQVYA